MAYTRTRLTTVYSSASDYASPTVNASYEIAESASTKKLAVVAAASISTGTTVELGTFTTVTSVMVKNLDTSATVIVGFTSSGTACLVSIGPLDFLKICAVTVANDIKLIHASLTPLCEVTVYGT